MRSVLLREGEQIAGLGCVGGDGFLDEQIDAGDEQRRGNCVMRGGGDANGCGVKLDFAARPGFETGVDGGVDGDAPLFSERGGPRGSGSTIAASLTGRPRCWRSR